MANDRLDGWKEISNYLNRGVRTLQRWEQERKLPVHRIPSSGIAASAKQSCVYAYASELDRWMAAVGSGLDAAAAGPEKPPAAPPEPAASPAPAPKGVAAAAPGGARLRNIRLQRIWLVPAVVAALPALVIGISYLSGVSLLPAPNPMSADLENRSRLVAFDASGRPLWTRQFSGPLAETSLGSHSLWQLAALDGSGYNSVLFSHRPLIHSSEHEEAVLCLGPEGSMRWQYAPGYRVTWAGIEYMEDFRLSDFSSGGKSGQGQHFVVVIANHVPLFPAQVSTVNAQGARIGDYWNTGHVQDHCVCDLDGDGIDEILIGGSNELRGRAFVAAIPHDLKRAISPVPENYAPSFATCEEIAYLEFLPSDVAAALQMSARVNRLSLHQQRYIRVETEIGSTPPVPECIRYIDLSDFRVTRIEFAPQYAGMHHRLKQERLLDHDMRDPAESEAERTMQPVRVTCR